MPSIDDIFNDQSFLKKATLDYKCMVALQAHHQDIFGQLANDLVVTMVRKGVAHIGASNPLWVNEIKRFKPDILKKMNVYTKGKGKIFDITVSFQPASVTVESTPSPVPVLQGLQEKIAYEVEKKKEDGQHLCPSCEAVYTFEKSCVFCRTAL